MSDAKAARPSLLTRSDTLLGICEGMGEDLGINANWLRVAFALALFFSPIGTIAAYLACGVIVLASRLLFPVPRAEGEVVALATETVSEEEDETLPLAA